MKSKKRLIILCVLLVITIGIWAAVTFPYPQQIQADQVEKVVGPGGQLDAKDAEKLIRLFNTAKYRGNDLGYGTTDEGAFSVHFKDGSILHIRNYGGKNYWVVLQKDGKYLKNNSYFIKSAGILAFYEELLDQAGR
jgi:hypothetical protein